MAIESEMGITAELEAKHYAVNYKYREMVYI